MRAFGLRDLVDCTGASLLPGSWGSEGSGGGTRLFGASTDTRTLKRGELFVALQGPSFDGNLFAPQAVRSGAAAVLLRLERGESLAADLLEGCGSVPILVHEDPRRALADLGGWYRSTLDARVVGITGSCGKTTVKDMLRDLLAPHMATVASPSSFNNDIGVPHSLLLADAQTRALVVELGTNHAGEIATLCRIARPDAGIITNIGASHLEGLGTLEGVAREKGDLAASLPREGFVVLNADCRFTPEIRVRTAARVITFGIESSSAQRGERSSGADLLATDLYFHSGGTTFRLNGNEITSPLLGTHNVQNLLAALGACLGLGLELEQVLPGVHGLSGGRQRMERLELDGITVFDDSYNSNPESLRAAVRVLAGLHGFERRVLVLGDMLELGELAAELHHELGREAARAGIDRIVLVGELAKAAAAGALEGGLPADAVVHEETTEGALPVVADTVRKGDVVLVKGSRRMQLERVVEHLVVVHGPGTRTRGA